MRLEADIVKGFRDILPPESLKRSEIKKVIERWFRLYGFIPIETPIIEFDESMRQENAEVEDEAVSDRFRLQDRGGRKLGLRYEFTFQLARIFKQNPNIKLPFKRYQIGEVFRDEPVSSSRFRQFTQCDADIIGDPSINADAECLALFSDILRELKVEAEIQINNRKLMTSIVESVQINKVKDVMKELDKIERIGSDQVKTNLKKYADISQILTLLKILDKDLSFFKKNVFAGVEEIDELIETCRQHGIKVKFNSLLVRGLGYYTGNVFEILPKGSKSSIAGGGRYDKTIGKFLTKTIPAVGISFGLERLSEIAEISSPNPTKALIISISQDTEAIKLSKKMRKANISCSLSFEKPSKSLEYANALKIPYAILIGEEEIGKRKYKLKNLDSGKEALLNEKQLIKNLK